MDSATIRIGPRERLRRHGVETLSDDELVALLLGTGARGMPVSVVAARVMTELGGLARLRSVGLGELAMHKGVGYGKASRVVAAIELGRRAANPHRDHDAPIASSQAAYERLRAQLAYATTEHIVVLALDAKNRIIREIRVATGGLTGCVLLPSDVFRPLMREFAVSAVVAHNHPSGDPRPSAEDVAFTERLYATGRLVGVPILDHLIVTQDGYFSFMEHGMLIKEAAE